jgi:hypothetical protein
VFPVFADSAAFWPRGAAKNAEQHLCRFFHICDEFHQISKSWNDWTKNAEFWVDGGGVFSQGG